jgi:hypothetical protein
MASNANNAAGTITLALAQITGVSGTGPLASIVFELPGSSPGVILSVSPPELLNSKGANVPAQATYSNPTAFTQQNISEAQTASGGGGGTSTTPVSMGTVTLPQEGGAPNEKVAVSQPQPATPTEPAQVPDKTAAAQPEKEDLRVENEPAHPAEPDGKKIDQRTSVLEAFRSFHGEKSPKSLVDLFTKAMEGTRQVPPVALSDGKTSVKVFVDAGGKETPSFALKGAKLVFIKTAESATWIVEVLPDQGVYDAAVTIMQGKLVRQIPLTVAPPLPAEMKFGEGGKLSESDFNRFLKESGSAKDPRFDLNRDGKRDYIDDYIFTANYLVKKRDFKVKGDAPKQ